MANGTKNVFVTQTKNPFLPYIQAFADFQFRYMNAQGQLAEKMYAFNKKREGEAFIKSYGDKIKGSKTLQETIGYLNEAVTEGGSRGLGDYLPIIQSNAKITEARINMKQQETAATEMYNVDVGTYGNSPINWKNEVTTYGAVAKEINDSDLTPENKLILLDAAKKQIGVSDTQLLIPEKGDKYSAATSSFDPTTEQTLGDFRQGFIEYDDEKKQYYIDYNQSGAFDKGETAPPDVIANMENEKRRRIERNAEISRVSKPHRVSIAYEGDNPNYKKGKVISALQKSDGKVYDLKTGKELPDQGNWIDRSSANYYTNQRMGESEIRQGFASRVQDSLRGLLAQGVDDIESIPELVETEGQAKAYDFEKYKGLYDRLATKINLGEGLNENELKVYETIKPIVIEYGGPALDNYVKYPDKGWSSSKEEKKKKETGINNIDIPSELSITGGL